MSRLLPVLRVPLLSCLLGLASGVGPSAFAADNFSYTATVSAQSVYQGFSTAEDFLNSFDTTALQALIPSYTSTSIATFTANFRGIPATFAYPGSGTTLTFNVPSLGIAQSFTGATRDDSQNLLEDYLKKDGQNILGQIMKAAAKASPNDPIAGNPNSLMGSMVATSFDAVFSAQASQIILGPPQAGDRANQFGLGLRFGSYKTGDVNSQTTTIPFSYTWRFDDNPRKQVILNMPLTYGTTEGAKLGHFAPTLGFVLPVTDRWTITPSAGYGVTGSIDLATVAQIVSGSVMSLYTLPLGDWSLSVGNLVGHYRTLKVSAGDFSADPKIANTVFRNGLMLAQPLGILGGDKILEYTFVDTRYTGTELFMRWYGEVGLTLGTARGRDGLKSYFRAGVSYLYSAGTHGWSLKFGYWF